MAFDIMRFLGGVNAYNTGQPIRGPSGSRGPILDLFKTPKEIIDEWSINNQAPTPEERERFNQGIDTLSKQLPPGMVRDPATGEAIIGVTAGVPAQGPVEGAPVQQATIPSPPSLGNQDWLLEAQAAQENRPERKGMFGMKGTLRDVVGLLGDAFLVQGGGKAMYLPQRQLERKSDAVVGMTAGMDRNDPATAAYLNAIERMAYEDPAAAEEMLKGFETRQLNQAVKENQIAQRTESTASNKYKRMEDARNYAARLLSSARTDEEFGFALQQAARVAKMAGTTLEELGVSPDMTPEERAVYGSGDMTVQQQRNLPLQERRVAAQESQAKSSAIRAARPPAGRAAPNPTSASMAAPLIDKVRRGGKLTPAEAETLDRLGYSVGKKKGGRREPPAIPPPPGFNFKPRN